MPDVLEMSVEEEANYKKKGIDIWLIRANLKLTHEERVAQHQNTLDCISALKGIIRLSGEQSATSFKISHQEPR